LTTGLVECSDRQHNFVKKGKKADGLLCFAFRFELRQRLACSVIKVESGGASTLSEINKTRGGHLSRFQKPSVHQIAFNLVTLEAWGVCHGAGAPPLFLLAFGFGAVFRIGGGK